MKREPPTCAARTATLDDFEEIAELLQRVFGVPQSAAVLRRKFTGCAGCLIGCSVLVRAGRIVGFLGQIPVRLCVAGRDVLAVQGADVGILEEHRRLDAFLDLIRASVRELEAAEVALAYGIVNADAGLSLAALLGKPAATPVPLLVRPLRGALPARVLAACARGVERVAGRGATSVPSGLRLARPTRFDDRFDRFWQRIRNDYRILLARDAAYLNARYANGSGAVYERICLERAATGEIEAYAVLRTARHKERLRGRVCDLVTPRRSDPRAAHALIEAAVAWLSAQQAEVADAWMFPHVHLRPALQQHGFIPRRTGPGGFSVSVLEAGAGLLGAEHAANWFLAMGDSDTV